MDRRGFSCNYCMFSGSFETIVNHTIQSHSKKPLSVRQRVVSLEDKSNSTKILRYGLIPQNILKIGHRITIDEKNLRVSVQSAQALDDCNEESVRPEDLQQSTLEEDCKGDTRKMGQDHSKSETSMDNPDHDDQEMDTTSLGSEMAAQTKNLTENDENKENETRCFVASKRVSLSPDSAFLSGSSEIEETGQRSCQTLGDKSNVRIPSAYVNGGGQEINSQVCSEKNPTEVLYSRTSVPTETNVRVCDEKNHTKVLYSRTSVPMETNVRDIEMYNSDTNSESYDTADEPMLDDECYDQELEHFIGLAIFHLTSEKPLEARKAALNAYTKLEVMEKDPFRTDFPFAEYYMRCMEIFLQVDDIFFALKCLYKDLLLADVDEFMFGPHYYPVHLQRVMVYWKQILSKFKLGVILRYMTDLKEMAHRYISLHDKSKACRIFHICSDLTITYRSLKQQFPRDADIDNGVITVAIESALVLLILGDHNGVKLTCKGALEMCGEDNPELLEIWARSLKMNKQYSVSLKKAQQALTCSKITPVLEKRLTVLISELHKDIQDETETEVEDSCVDSDNEWLTDTNVSTVKKQKDKAERQRSENPHEKKTRRRPKRKEDKKPQEYKTTPNYMTGQIDNWNDIQTNPENTQINAADPYSWFLNSKSKKRSRRRRNTSGSGMSTNSSGNCGNKKQCTDVLEEDFPGYDGSDLETDEDFDNETVDDAPNSDMNSDVSSCDNLLDDMEDDRTMYEKSCDRFSEDVEVEDEMKVEENNLLLNGLDLSHEFVEKFQFRRADNFYKGHLSERELKTVCSENPKKFKKCIVHIESSHGAVATVIDPIDDVKEIEISGRSKCGHNIFTEDEVVVEILKQEKPEGKDIIPRFNPNFAEKLNEVRTYGKVIGKLSRQRFDKVDHPILVCILDDFQMDLMKPLCKTVPKMHILNRHTENRFEVEVYDYDDTSGELNYKDKKLIDPAHRKGYVFLVAYLKWDSNMIYPLGAVVDIIKSGGEIGSGMKILRLQHQVPYMYRYPTIRSVQSLMCRMPVEPHETLTQGRVDLTKLTVFTIDPQKSKDLDDALSIEKIKDGVFRVGVHIADVSSYIKKDDHVDREARDRAVTFYPGQGYNPYHMLPEPLSQNLCSLVPGKKRLALSIFFTLDKEGKQLQPPDIKKTVIQSRRQFSYNEVQGIIMETNNESDQSLVNDIKQLYMMAKNMRKKRLGNAMFALPVEVSQLETGESILETLEAHYLVEEYMVLANHMVATCLLRRFPGFVPLRCQNPPKEDEVQKWLKSYEDIADTVLHLQGIHPLPHRKLDLKNAKPQRYTRITLLQETIWKKMVAAIDKEQNFREAWKMIGCDEIHPKQALSYIEWISFQESASYKCSGTLKNPKQEGRHFSLGIFPYCHFTSPIRRYTDIIVHRLLHAALENKPSPYTTQEVDDLSTHINAVSKRAKAYQKQCQTLIWGHKLRKEPVMFSGFARDISEKFVTFHIPGMRTLPKNCKELPCSLLNLSARPEIGKNNDLVELKWKRRVYSHTGYSPFTNQQNEGRKRIDPHQRARFIHFSGWMDMLKAVVEGKTQKLKSVFTEENSIERYKLKKWVPQCFNTVTDVTSEVRGDENIIKQCCDFSLSITHGQILGIQITAEPVKGTLVPVPQMFDVSRSVKCCLQHVRDPVSHFASYSTTHSKPQYSSPTDYIQTWRPLVAMEAAVSTVRGESAFVNDLPVKFEPQGGRFTLRISFCEPRNIEFNTMSMDFMVKDEEENEEVQYVASSDYLCIRCVVDKEGKPVSPVDSTEVLQNGGKVWIAHAEVDKIKKRKKKDRVDVHFQIHKNSQQPLQSLKDAEKNPRCCVEVLQKSEDIRRTEAILDWLDKATPLAKAIALGRKCPKLDKDHLDLSKKIEGDLNIYGLAGNNTQQHKAIQKALTSTFSVIQGPPGTGKTYTGIKLLYLFNKINKIWHEEGNPLMQILFCGPSNKSVDLVARWMIKKLGDQTPKIVRMYGSSMEQVDYPVPGKSFSITRGSRDAKPDKDLVSISAHHLIRQNGKSFAEEIRNYDKRFRDDPKFSDFEQVKEYTSLVSKATQEELKNYNIIFCTTAVAANPKFLKGTKGRIYQVIIDECGMCTEPESMVPIVASQAKQVVLIGDHKQLRPVVLCKDAADLGLEKSLFERYADRATFLNMQYRMNPRICDFPSQRFYGGKLLTGPSLSWEVFRPLEIWPYAEIPHVFCNIEGEENKLPVATEEGSENSCKNEEEVKQVVKVFKHLVDKEGVDPAYINVISQYNAQCCALRDALKTERCNKLNVNTVVASQGGEWDYVIFSTVRSLPDYKIEPNPTLGWCKENLGFITDDHQINVALTRSKKGLIIIGNRNLLKCDKVWKALLDHYDKAGCIVEAKDFPKPPKRRRRRNAGYSRQTSRDFYHGTDHEEQ